MQNDAMIMLGPQGGPHSLLPQDHREKPAGKGPEGGHPQP